jgi:putative membrane protein
MITGQPKSKDTRFLVLIAILSIAIPVVVAFLFYMPKDAAPGKADVSMLPGLHATLNSLTALALISGYYFIRKGDRVKHRASMLTAFVLSSLFLISYVTYHFLGPKTYYGGEGMLRYIYFFVLLTHIVLAVVIVPLVLLSVYFALSGQFQRHRKVSRWTFPIWLYVAITGVLVFLMISPYYK